MDNNLEIYDEYGFPKKYSKERLAQMRSQLTISVAQYQTIQAYFEAANHLYSLIPLGLLFEIYNRQNEPVSQEDFLQAAEVIAHEQHIFSVLRPEVFFDVSTPSNPIDQEVVADHLYSLGDEYYFKMRNDQSDKPWYIPDREEFLQYADRDYIEKTPQFMDVLQHLLKTQRKLHCPPLDIAIEFSNMLRMDTSLEDILHDGQRLGMQFQNQEDFRVFLNLLLGQSQHTRRYSLRGHTPSELGITAINPAEAEKLTWDPNYQDPVAKLAAMMNSRIGMSKTISGKPAQNALCPCGSGRKYKNCCGKKK